MKHNFNSKNYLRLFYFLFAILYLFNCKAQEKTKEIKFPLIGWTIQIPSNSNFLTSIQIDSIQEETNKKTRLDLELSKDEVLFLIRKDTYNYFGSSATIFDSTKFSSWEESYSLYKQYLVDLILSKKSLITLIDTASSTEQINGITFQRFYTKTGYPGKKIILENYWYYSKIRDIELSINILFDKKENGEFYLSLLKSSSFEK